MAMFNARLEFNVINEFAELGMLLVQSVQGNLNILGGGRISRHVAESVGHPSWSVESSLRSGMTRCVDLLTVFFPQRSSTT